MTKTLRSTFLLLLCTVLIHFSTKAQTWEVYDYDLQLKSRLVYQSIAILSDAVKIGKNENGLFLLSNDYKPAVQLEGKEIYQFLEPWILMKGEKGIGAYHEYGQKVLNLEFDEIQTYYNFLLARKGNEYWVYQRGKGTTNYLGELDEARISNVGQIISRKGNSYFLPLSSNPDRPFEKLEDNDGEYILAKTKDGYGLVNVEGNLVLDPVIDELQHTKGNFYYGFDEGQYVLIEGDLVQANIRYNSYHKITYQDGLMLEYIHGKLRRVMEGNGILLDAVGMTEVIRIDQDLYNVRFRDGKLGLLGIKGWLVNPTDSLEKIENGSEGYFPARKKGQYGYVNREGKWLIKPTYDLSLNYSEQIAAFKSGLYWGAIDNYGKVILNPEWEEIKAFQGGFGVGKKENRFYLFSKEGNQLTPGGFSKICRIDNGYFLVENDQKVGLLDPNGKQVLSPDYEYLKRERANWVIARKNNKSGLIDEKGETLLPFDYEEILFDNANRQILVRGSYQPILVVEPETQGRKRKRGN